MRGSLLRILKRYQPLPSLSLISLVLVLNACSQADNVVRSVHTLNQRIANTLDTNPAQLSFSPRPAPMPAVRKLKPTGEAAGMNFLTSLRLGHCQAGQLIAERNSSLGRLEDGLMRYQDDVVLLNALKRCAEHPQSADIRDEIQRAVEDKQQQNRFDKAHAIATDDALRHSLTIASQPLVRVDDDAFNLALSALTGVSQWLTAPESAEQLAGWRQQLAQSDYLPRLLRSTIEMRLKLKQLQQQLPPLTAAAGCDAKGVPERASVLRQVFMRFFITEVQADLAALTTQYQQLAPVLQQLSAQTPQPALTRYLTELSQQGERLSEASKAFVQPWQQLFAACGFTPGAD